MTHKSKIYTPATGKMGKIGLHLRKLSQKIKAGVSLLGPLSGLARLYQSVHTGESYENGGG